MPLLIFPTHFDPQILIAIAWRPGGGSSPIFVRGCAISGFETPPFAKARQPWKFDPFVRQIREKVGKNDPKMYDSEDFRKFLPLKSANMHF